MSPKLTLYTTAPDFPEKPYVWNLAHEMALFSLGRGLESIAEAARGKDLGTSPTRHADISVREFSSGSGPCSFGGVRKWPGLDLKVGFPALEEAERDAVLGQLEAWLRSRGFTVSVDRG